MLWMIAAVLIAAGCVSTWRGCFAVVGSAWAFAQFASLLQLLFSGLPIRMPDGAGMTFYLTATVLSLTFWTLIARAAVYARSKLSRNKSAA